VIAVLVSAEPLTIILVDKKFIGSKEFVLWGALTEGLRIFSTVISQVAIAEMKMNALFWASLVPAILTLGFQLGLVRHNPTLISGLSLFIGMFSNVIIGLIIARCLLPITFPWKSIGKAIAYSLPMVVLFFYRKNFMGFLFTTFGNEGWKHYLSPMIFLLAVFCLWVLPVLMTLKLRHDE
jgi:hypothetical protein